MYKIQVLDDVFKIVKARIAPHVNKNRENEELKDDSATFHPVCLRKVLSIAVLFK